MFNKEVLNYTEERLTMVLDEIIEENLPEGKTIVDFTGGYVQQLKHRTVVVLFFGYKGKNPLSVKINIDPKEIDLYYMMVKAKTMNLINDERRLKVSATERLAVQEVENWGEGA